MSDGLSKSHLPWRLRVGRRVAVRHRIPRPDDTAPALTDVTGQLIAVDDSTLSIRSDRLGEVVVPLDLVVAAKEIPDRQARPGSPHRTARIDVLERLMIDGMPPLHRGHIGEWVLRSSEGYTGRANSVLAVGDPGCSLEQAIDEAGEWYAGMQQPTLFQICGPLGFDVEAHPVAGVLLRRGADVYQRTYVLTAAVAEVAMAERAQRTVMNADSAPNNKWWAAASSRSLANRPIVERIHASVDDGSYLRLDRVARVVGCFLDLQAVASVRLAYSPGWVGVFDLHVLEEFRRAGYARTLMGHAARQAQARGVRSVYLQVSADNAGAISLYESLGFTTHHEYWYARL